SVVGVVSAFGRVFAGGSMSPGRLYALDPSQPAGGVTTVATSLGNGPAGIASDGIRFWTANQTLPGSVSIITPTVSIPWTVTTVTISPGSSVPLGVLFDGANVWATDF